MANLTFSQLESLWVQAGGDQSLAPTMAAIALAESGGNPASNNYTDNDGTQTSWGLWQISDGNHNQPDPNINTPLDNAKAAVAKYNSQGLGAWGTYTSGAYLKEAPQGTNVAPPATAHGVVAGNDTTAASSSAPADWAGLAAAAKVPGGTQYLEGLAAQTGDSASNSDFASTTIGGQVYSTTGTNAQSDVSAISQMESTLASYGFSGQDLNTLTSWAWGEITSNTDPAQVVLDIQTPGSVAYPIFEKQFPYFTQVNQQLTASGNPALSVGEYQTYQSNVLQAAQAAGLPPGMVTAQEVATLAAGNVSQAEYTARLNNVTAMVTNADPAVLQSFNDYFGAGYGTAHGPLTTGQLAAIVLDPTNAEPLIQQQIAAAQVGGSAQVAGLGSVSETEAMKIAQSNAGLSQAQISSAIGSVAPLTPLEAALPGTPSPQSTVNADTLVGSVLLPTAENTRALQVAEETRKAPFAGGGGDVSTQKGLVGAGSAQGSGTGS